MAIWSSQDALIIKVLTSIMQEWLKPFLLKTCYHLKSHGGLKGAVRDVMKQLPIYNFFCKTNVHSYYDSIDHHTMLIKLHDYMSDRIIIGYVWQFLNRCVEWGGLYQDFRKGIHEDHRCHRFWEPSIYWNWTRRLRNWRRKISDIWMTF